MAAHGTRMADQLLRSDPSFRSLPAFRAARATAQTPRRRCSPRFVHVSRRARGPVKTSVMFSGFMVNAWEVASVVAVVAGVVGFFTVLRGSAFAAHAIPNGSFAGAAGASLVGVSTLLGLGVFALAGALGIGLLGRRGRHDAATAPAPAMMLGLGALFPRFIEEYAPAVYSLLFGEVLGISSNDIAPTAILGLLCIAAVAVLYRPLMLSSVLPEVGEARGVSRFRMEMLFLAVLALAPG